jgi:uncharacterized protein (TIGR02118 family)
MLKLNILAVRRSGMTRQEFVEYCRDKHAPFFVDQPIVKKTVRRYIQSHPVVDLPPGVPEAPYDGIVQLWFENMAGFLEYIQSPNYQNVIKLDEERFVDHSKIKLLFSEEFPVLAEARQDRE